jgi:hypothetical protein
VILTALTLEAGETGPPRKREDAETEEHVIPAVLMGTDWNPMGSNYLRPSDIEKRKKYLETFTVYVLNHFNDHVREWPYLKGKKEDLIYEILSRELDCVGEFRLNSSLRPNHGSGSKACRS